MFLDANTGYFIPDIEKTFEEFLDSVFDAYDLYPRTFFCDYHDWRFVMDGDSDRQSLIESYSRYAIAFVNKQKEPPKKESPLVGVRGVYVEGRLSDLLRGVSNFSNIALDCVGMPINDTNGNVIGKIHTVDVSLDKWYGRIVTDTSIFNTVSRSLEIKGE